MSVNGTSAPFHAVFHLMGAVAATDDAMRVSLLFQQGDGPADLVDEAGPLELHVEFYFGPDPDAPGKPTLAVVQRADIDRLRRFLGRLEGAAR